jgi:flagellar protein FlaG
MSDPGFCAKDTAMLIQTNLPTHQAVLPDVRVSAPVPTQAVVVSVTVAPVSPTALHSAVKTINAALQASNLSLEFSVDTDTHATVVKLTDTSTGQLVRQFPSDATLAISREIDQLQQGLLLKQKA